jgi:hypothetical protein
MVEMFPDSGAACTVREQLLVCGCYPRLYQRESGELSVGGGPLVGAKAHRVPLLAVVGRQSPNLAPPRWLDGVVAAGVAGGN